MSVKENENKKKKRIWLRITIILLSVVLFACSVLGVLQLGSWYTEKYWEHWRPTYEKVDITPLFSKTELTEEDYETLYRQTGLTKLGVDGLFAANRQRKMLDMQEVLFAEHQITADHFAPFTYIEEIETEMPLAVLEDGDILVSATTRVSWWRYGHAAIVINGKSGQILESLSPGVNSAVSYANTFADLANFLVLRPKMDAEVRIAAAQYAKENLQDIPYQMTTGIFTKKYNPEGLKTSQCAHLVWYAYKTQGYDLDSNGGLIVKPQDIALSEHVEVVQAFGFDLDTLWS